MKLIVGLGNPGLRYRDTWHNLGRKAVELIAVRWGLTFKAGKGDYLFTDKLLSDRKVTLLLPTAYMNRSGYSVSQWLRYNNVDPVEMLVIYDDHDIPLGRIRLRDRGTSGGHRGMDDIIRVTGTDNIPRLKIGIKIEREKDNLSDQVLSVVPKKLIEHTERILQYAADLSEELFERDLEKLMAKYNGMFIE